MRDDSSHAIDDSRAIGHRVSLVRMAACLLLSSVIGAADLSGQNVPLTAGAVVESGDQRAAQTTLQVESSCSVRSDWRRRSLSVGRVTSTVRAAQAYFGAKGFEVARTVGVTAGSSAKSAYSEIASDFVHIGGPLGYGRVGLAGMLTAPNQSQDTDADSVKRMSALDSFLGGGGNAVLYLASPLVHYESRAGGCSDSRFDLIFLPRIVGALPALGALSRNATGAVDVALEAQWVAVSVASTFRFYGTSRLGYLRGAREFVSELGLGAADKRSFGYLRWELGIDVMSKARVSVIGLARGPKELNRTPSAVQVQLLK